MLQLNHSINKYYSNSSTYSTRILDGTSISVGDYFFIILEYLSYSLNSFKVKNDREDLFIVLRDSLKLVRGQIKI